MLLSETADFRRLSYDDITERFKQLRAYGRLPKGRQNREAPLSNEQIAYAILALTTPYPSFAGLCATVLGNLRPVGGAEAVSGNPATFLAAISDLLAEPSRIQSIRLVRCSISEFGTNSNGHAEIQYYENGGVKSFSFVHELAVSLVSGGAEVSYDVHRSRSAFTREVVFTQTFFHRISREVDIARTIGAPPLGDGSEYEEEEGKACRYQRLGVRPGSRYLNIGVDTQVTWPRTERLIRFDEYTLVLMPKTKEKTQSVHVDLTHNRLSDEEALTLVNRFLSVLVWCDDQFAITQGGWSGNPIPVEVSKRDLSFATADHWLIDRRIPAGPEQRQALALYREGRNAEQNFLVSFAVLSFYKILEIRFRKGKTACWLRRNENVVRQILTDKELWGRFDEMRRDEPSEIHLQGTFRKAVAHASPDAPVDPDELHELRRLHDGAEILRAYARVFIREELGISESMWSGD